MGIYISYHGKWKNKEIEYSIQYDHSSAKICVGKNWKEIYQKISGDYLWVVGLWVTFFLYVFWYFKIVYNEHILLCLMRKKLKKKT